ncbi:MAG: hypothetical protein HC894_05615 [Microcoleus sp. SM1_3_4]|nr:hypothetical protein [Microcoleus sp. SM1_3_4]
MNEITNYQLSTINYQLRAGTGALPPLRESPYNCQLSTIDYQRSTVNDRLSTINYRRSTIDYQLLWNFDISVTLLQWQKNKVLLRRPSACT